MLQCTLCFRKIRLSVKIRLLLPETLFQTQEFKKLARNGEGDINSDSVRSVAYSNGSHDK